MTTYRAISPLTRAFLMVLPVLLVGGFLWAAAGEGARPIGEVPRFSPVLIVGCFIGYAVFRMAHTIVRRDTDGCLEFHTFFGNHVVPVREIVSISPAFLHRGQLIVAHAHGSVAMPAQFEGLYDVLEWIRRENPNVAYRGI